MRDSFIGNFPNFVIESLKRLSELQDVVLPESTEEEIWKAMNEICVNNTKRVSLDMDKISNKIGKMTYEDMVRFLANELANQTIKNTVFEGRRRMIVSDVYLGLYDYPHIFAWGPDMERVKLE